MKIFDLIISILIFLLVIFIFESILNITGYSVDRQRLQGDAGIDLGLLDTWNESHMYEKTSNGLFYELKRNKIYEINEDRYRGKIIPKARDQNVFRLALLGDSSGFGVENRYSRAFIHVLADLISRRQQCSVEYINASVPGYTSLQGKRLFEQRISLYQPDLVLTYFGCNDFASIFPYEDKELKQLPELFEAFYNTASRFKVMQFISSVYIKYVIPTFWKLKQRVSNQDYINNLDAIEERAKTYGGVTRFIMPVMICSDENGDQRLLAFFQFAGDARLNDNSAISIIEHLYADDPEMYKKLFLDVVHPTAKGHRLIAEAIYSHLEDEGLFEHNFPLFKGDFQAVQKDSVMNRN